MDLGEFLVGSGTAGRLDGGFDPVGRPVQGTAGDDFVFLGKEFPEFTAFHQEVEKWSPGNLHGVGDCPESRMVVQSGIAGAVVESEAMQQGVFKAFDFRNGQHSRLAPDALFQCCERAGDA